MDQFLRLCALLKATASLCERRMNAAMAQLKISHCQADVLVRIRRQGPQTMSGLSHEMHCHKSNITQVVDGLVAKKLVERISTKTDRRISMLSLTKKGRSLALKAETVLASSAKKCVSLFTSRERVQFTELLDRVITAGGD